MFSMARGEKNINGDLSSFFQENDQRREQEKKMEARRLQREAEQQRKNTGKGNMSPGMRFPTI